MLFNNGVIAPGNRAGAAMQGECVVIGNDDLLGFA
jgi:hypothetical protein